MDLIRKNEAKIIRGRILKILDIYPFEETGDEVIKDTLNDAEINTNTAVLAGHLAYLEEKGYIDVREAKDRDISMRMARLTAKGKDLLEGNIDPDVGVKL